MSFEALHPSLRHHVLATLEWRTLRPLQQRAIAPVLAGDHALLSAPTAGGKTEAALLPLISRMLDERWEGLSVLYVCPLRALLNDLLPRAEQLCGFVGRRAALWHGDVPAGDRARILRDPPDLLLTTPESLEAMAISTRVDHRRLLGGVRAVVVDEVHAFAGDDRGWHLLAVLARLDALLDVRVQRIGLSATVGNPEWLLDWLVNDPEAPTDHARSVVIVQPAEDAAPPEIEVDWVASVENAARVIAALHRGEKRLVFADSRARVEEVAAALRALDVTVFVSHSSLAAAERRDSEAAFREARDCVIVATSTLELGIDVGDLERVIQIGAPATVASLLQRLGRSGRRSGTVRNCLFLATRDEELLQALALVVLGDRGWVEPLVPPAMPVHLAAQQLLARVLSEGRLGQGDWPGPIARVLEQAGISSRAAANIVQHGVEHGMLTDDGGVLAIGPEGERSHGRRHFLDVTSLFLTEPLLTVRHGRRDLGAVDPSVLVARGPGQQAVVLLGGRAWGVRSVDWDQGVAWVEPSDDPGKSRWAGEGRALSYDVCQVQRDVLAGTVGVDHALTDRGRARLATLREEVGEVPKAGTWLVRDAAASRTWWWTFAGLRANNHLAAALERAGVRVGAVDDLRVAVGGGWAADDPTPLDLAAVDAPAPAEARLDAVKFSSAVPRPLLSRMLQRRDTDEPALSAVAAGTVTRSVDARSV